MTTTIMTPAQYEPFTGYDRVSRTYHCDCWVCGDGVERKTHNNAVKAGIKAGIRVQCHQTALNTGYGNRCPDCYDK